MASMRRHTNTSSRRPDPCTLSYAPIRRPRRRALYLGRHWNGDKRAAFVLGASRAQSDSLLDELWQFVAEERYAWYHEWRVGDYVMWDNRCVMHRRGSFNSAMRRVMHRTQIKDSVRPT